MDSQPSVARSGRICDALPPRRSPRKINRSFKRGSGGAGRSQSGGRWAPGLGWRRAGAAIQQRRPSLTAARRGREQAKNRISERMFHVKHPFRNEAYSFRSTPPPLRRSRTPIPRAMPRQQFPKTPRSYILPIRSWTRSKPYGMFSAAARGRLPEKAWSRKAVGESGTENRAIASILVHAELRHAADAMRAGGRSDTPRGCGCGSRGCTPGWWRCLSGRESPG